MAKIEVAYNSIPATIYFDSNSNNAKTGQEFFGVVYTDPETSLPEWATPDEDIWHWAEHLIEHGEESAASLEPQEA